MTSVMDIGVYQQDLEDKNESIASPVSRKDVSLKVQGSESSITKGMYNSPRLTVSDTLKTADTPKTADMPRKVTVRDDSCTRLTSVLKTENKRQSNKTIQYYYDYQYNSRLDDNKNQRVVNIYIALFICNEWKEGIKYGIQEINTAAAPGLKLVLMQSVFDLKQTATPEMIEMMQLVFDLSEQNIESKNIAIYPGKGSDECVTTHSILTATQPFDTRIYLGNLESFNVKRTAVHELLHGLGFEHEHQRKDAKQYLRYPENCENDQDLVVKDNYVPLTAFDPYSIILYKEQDEESEGFCRDSHEMGN